MKEVKILICGAGYTAPGLLHFLLERPLDFSFKCLLIDTNGEKLKERQQAFPEINIQNVDANEIEKLSALISMHDITVSLLPPNLHKSLAELCITHQKHLITSSYLTPEIQVLDLSARQNNVSIIMEAGLDPGLDAILLKKTIKDLESQKKSIHSVKSYVGSFFESEQNNLFPYIITWNPQNVVDAGKHGANYLQNNKKVRIEYSDIFKEIDSVFFDKIGDVRVYPNRDSIQESTLYNLSGGHTFIRGTLRSSVFLSLWRLFVQLRFTSEDQIEARTIEDNYRGIVYLCSENQKLMLEDLGMFSNEQIPLGISFQYELLKYLVIQNSIKNSIKMKEFVLMHQEILGDDYKGSFVLKTQIIKERDDLRFSSMSFMVGAILFEGIHAIINEKELSFGVHRVVDILNRNLLISDLTRKGIVEIENTLKYL